MQRVRRSVLYMVLSVVPFPNVDSMWFARLSHPLSHVTISFCMSCWTMSFPFCFIQ
ncbi:hypothetical protein CPB84DRAFT_1791776 [Gymnopilus junonius]|uniref:Uncharacterized protein n=1 Tax=Gymnopilus junonius TaxID=109634 RepID=A0A9P5THH6_GYMJU|nr:hypothetical protein CPB84DRAFT_1791776 [Gymnopilus junonius]